MKHRWIVSSASLIFLMASSAFAREQLPDVKEAVTQWKEAVELGSIDEVMKLYDNKAVMISTFHQQPMTKRAEIVSYYRKALANPDRLVEVTSSHPRRLGNTAINSGNYVFSYTQDGEPVEIEARFSFTYALQDGKWVIVDHHSSRVPLADAPK